MYFPIVCTCGQSLGDLADAFKMIRHLRTQEAIIKAGRYIDPSILGTVDDLQPALGKDLTALGLVSQCCRLRMLSCVEFKEVY